MGFRMSLIGCNLYMEHLKLEDIRTVPHPPFWWCRYVDGTHAKLKKEYALTISIHWTLTLNSQLKVRKKER
ncbi:hypothetical protein HOLleu_22098 [Holothuria leucospilota]|uniref:Uncharacterized protein n=1 Tax=Holothuria leucospilota TaxID=206669 RepID=A0A9Q1H6X3_HOLLE|nr:hypothetical protein HOLleu_22098 [Holothuria leucospilota]